jgi:ribosomal 50S subunit-recycling heat shock protein
VKRRPLAALLCREGHVTVNGREAGPGHAVRIGDRLGVRLRRERLEVEVLSLPGKGRSAEGCCRVTARETAPEE